MCRCRSASVGAEVQMVVRGDIMPVLSECRTGAEVHKRSGGSGAEVHKY